MEEKKEQELLDPKKLFRTIGQIRKEAKPLEPLWGFFLYKKAITQVTGDPGVCKTTFGYGLGTTLCKGEPFLDIGADEPIRAIYMDFESSDSLVVSRANLIQVDDQVNFYIYNIVDYYLQHLTETTIKFCNNHEINLIFIDNQSTAFNTRDENDNTEGSKQMKYLRALATACNSAILIYHHPSKSQIAGVHRGRGASSRPGLADICINIDIPDEDNSDIIRLQVVKNRMVDEKVLWYLKKEEGQFIFAEPPLGINGQPTNTLLYKAQQAILEIVNGNQQYKYDELVNLAVAKGIDKFAVGNALKRLVQQGRLTRPKYGYYGKLVS